MLAVSWGSSTTLRAQVVTAAAAANTGESGVPPTDGEPPGLPDAVTRRPDGLPSQEGDAPSPREVSSERRAAVQGPSGQLSVYVQDEQGSIWVDGQEVGQGQFQGELQPGQHQLRVVRSGFEPFEVNVEIRAGEVRTESVALRRTVTVVPVPAFQQTREQSGLYGGIQLLGTVLPGGTGTTLEAACDTTGATSCTKGTPLGAGLGGYFGWLFDPLGFELALFGAADVVQQRANFDGEQGSEINPIVAAPAREEKFIIGRFGGGAALRARVALSLERARFSFALGPGLVFRTLAFRRETAAEGGFSGEFAETGISYVSPLLSGELAAQLRLTQSFALSLGIVSWLERAGNDATSEARNDTLLIAGAGTRPVIQATPAYDVAGGTQWFVGPFLGAAFGP